MEQQQLLMIEQAKALTAMAQFATEFARAKALQVELELARERKQAERPQLVIGRAISTTPTKVVTTAQKKPDPAEPMTEQRGSTLPMTIEGEFKALGSMEDLTRMSREMATWACGHADLNAAQSLQQICTSELKHVDDCPLKWRFADKWLEYMAKLGHVSVSYYGDTGKMYWRSANMNVFYTLLYVPKLPWEI